MILGNLKPLAQGIIHESVCHPCLGAICSNFCSCTANANISVTLKLKERKILSVRKDLVHFLISGNENYVPVLRRFALAAVMLRPKCDLQSSISVSCFGG